MDWISTFDGQLQTRRHGPRQEVLAVDASLSRLVASGAARLAGALPVLEELALSGTHFPTTAFDEEAAAALIATGSCERLAVNAAALDVESLVRLLAGLGPLHTLDLAGTALNADAVRAALRLQPGLAELRLGTALPRGFEHRFAPVMNGGDVLDAVGELQGLECLSLRGLEIADEPASLANLGALTRLDIGETRAGDVTAQVLARSPTLRELRIDRTLLSDSGLEALASHGGLLHLDLSGTLVSAAGVVYLTGQRQLRQLSLRSLRVSDAHADIFKSLTGLHELDLSGTAAGSRTVESLAEAPALRTLRLPNVKPDAVGACIGLRSLRHLRLSVDKPPWAELARLDALEDLVAPMDSSAQLPPNLRRIWTDRLETDSVGRLSSAPRLEALRLSGGAIHLAKLHPSGLPELRELFATESDLDDLSLRRVLALPAMEALYVSDTAITARSLEGLADAQFVHTLELRNIPLDRSAAERISRLRRLHCLDVPGTGLGEVEIALLARAPNLQSIALDPSQITASSMAALANAPIVELYIYGDVIAPQAFAHAAALRGLLELKVMNAALDVAHAKAIAAIPSLRVVQGAFDPQAADLLATLRPELRGFVRTGQGRPMQRGMGLA
jgi:hypothetical protein